MEVGGEAVERGVVRLAEENERHAVRDLPERPVLLDHVRVGFVAGERSLRRLAVGIGEGHDGAEVGAGHAA